MTIQVAVRLPDSQVKAIDEMVARGGGSRSEVIRRALEVYLYRLACEEDARRYAARPLTDTELALADDPRSWSATPAW